MARLPADAFEALFRKRLREPPAPATGTGAYMCLTCETMYQERPKVPRGVHKRFACTRCGCMKFEWLDGEQLQALREFNSDLPAAPSVKGERG